MILPIHVYGSPVLREPTREIESDSSELQQLIDDMFETLYGASGIGLAAPQIGRSERLFVVDLRPMARDLEDDLGEVPDYAREPLVFINPVLTELDDAPVVDYEEGCLSIPDLREDVDRPDAVRVSYLDREFEPQELLAKGVFARVLQHEYDHLEGVLFIDRLSALRRRLLQRRLRAMARGEAEADYPLTFGTR